MKLYKGFVLATTGLMFSAMVAGCGASLPQGNGISVSKQGTITQQLSEPVSDTLSDVDDISSFIQDEVNSYNTEKGTDAVAMSSCSESKDTITAELTYASAEDYEAFNNLTLFSGTVEEAIAAGYDLQKETFKNSLGETASAEDIEAAAGRKVLILQEPVNVLVPGKILFVSDQVTISGKKLAVVNSDDGREGFTDRLNYIIYK